MAPPWDKRRQYLGSLEKPKLVGKKAWLPSSYSEHICGRARMASRGLGQGCAHPGPGQTTCSSWDVLLGAAETKEQVTISSQS